jgi:hypothetical protein
MATYHVVLDRHMLTTRHHFIHSIKLSELSKRHETKPGQTKHETVRRGRARAQTRSQATNEKNVPPTSAIWPFRPWHVQRLSAPLCSVPPP